MLKPVVDIRMLRDLYNRQIRDLRVSLTDRCNFRCFYCNSSAERDVSNQSDLLTFDEIETVCEVFVSLGIEKIRLTGGEPLVRKDVELLVAKLAKLKGPAARSADEKVPPTVPTRLREVAMITNGSNFPNKAAALKLAGLDRVTFSLDSMKPKSFLSITGVDKLDDVLDAIDVAKTTGFNQIKVNAVIIRGRNDNEIVDLARFARRNELAMRFIEFMPLDSGRIWDRTQIVSGAEIRERISEVFPLILTSPSRGQQTAWKYSFTDGAKGEIGIISPVTDSFCGACSRVRLTSDGQIRTCLFSTKEYDLRGLLRNGGTRSEIVDFIRSAVIRKESGHAINTAGFEYASRSMSAIGG